MAQKNLTRLNVALTMTTGAFTRSTQSAIKAAGAMGERMKGAILGPVGLITGALSTGAFVVAVRQAAQRIDELAKSADRLGVSTQSLAGFRYAAEQTGVGVEQLQVAMTKLQVRVEQAAAGNKAAADSLTALGLRVQDLARIPADQQFAAVSDAVRRMGSASQQSAAAVAVFGEEGAKMGNLLALGSSGLAKATQEAERLGLALNRVDAAKVEEANVSMGRIAKVIEGAMNVAAVKFAPIITLVADEMTRASANTQGFGTVLDMVIRAGVAAVGFLANAWQGLNFIFLGLRAAVYAVGGGFVTMANAAVADAQRIGIFFERSWDAIKASAEVLFEGLKAGWAYAKVPIADFVQFAGSQIASLLRTMSEAVMRFDADAGAAILSASNTVQVSVGAMGVTARQELDKSLKDVSAATERAGAAYKNLFADYQVTGSQALQELGASMQAQIEADMSAMEDMLNSSSPWQQLEDRVAYEKQAAQTRAEARAVEVEEAAKHSKNLIEIKDQENKIIRWEWEQRYKWESETGENNRRQAYAATSTFLSNLSALQQSHSKRARAIGDAAARAKIVTDTATAAMAAYQSLAGIPIIGPGLGAAAAAAAIAAGAVQLSNVGKNSIGGAPNMGSPGDSAGSSLANQTQRSPSQTVVLQGDMISSESIVSMFKQAKEQGFVIEEIRRA